MLKTTTCTTSAVHIAPSHRASPLGALRRADDWQMTPRTRCSATCTTPQELQCTTGRKGYPCNVAPHLLDPKRTMNVVVPGEETLTVGPCGFDRPELFGEVGPVLQGFERRLAERVVVGHVRTRVGLGDAEVGEQERDRFGGHRRPADALLFVKCLAPGNSLMRTPRTARPQGSLRDR